MFQFKILESEGLLEKVREKATSDVVQLTFRRTVKRMILHLYLCSLYRVGSLAYINIQALYLRGSYQKLYHDSLVSLTPRGSQLGRQVYETPETDSDSGVNFEDSGVNFKDSGVNFKDSGVYF